VIDTVLRAMVESTRNTPRPRITGLRPSFVLRHASRDGETYRCSGTMHGGWGASRGQDGPGPYKTMAHGDTLDVPVEVQEALYPIRIEAQILRANSGGHGEFRAATASRRSAIFSRPSRRWSTSTGKAVRRGACSAAMPAPRPTSSSNGPACRSSADQRRDPVEGRRKLHIISGGGGGYGDPRKRDPAKVQRDVRLGNITADVAAEVYGVT